MNNGNSPVSSDTTLRWVILRDALFFQIKLAVDAARDLLLSPISIAATIFDLLFTAHQQQDLMFYKVLKLGRSSERWINLFGASPADDESHQQTKDAATAGLDRWVMQLETIIKEQHEQGGLTSSAKKTIDRLLDTLQEGANRGKL